MKIKYFFLTIVFLLLTIGLNYYNSATIPERINAKIEETNTREKRIEDANKPYNECVERLRKEREEVKRRYETPQQRLRKEREEAGRMLETPQQRYIRESRVNEDEDESKIDLQQIIEEDHIAAECRNLISEAKLTLELLKGAM